MITAIKRVVMRWLRIPPDPRPPAGSEASIELFRASPRYLQYTLLGWGVRQLGVLIGLLFAIGFSQVGLGIFGVGDVEITAAIDEIPGPIVAVAEWLGFIQRVQLEDGGPVKAVLAVDSVLFWAELIGVAGFLVQLPLTLIFVLLSYELRWYIVTDRSLRVREGVGRIREITMTFANVQHLSVEQGPLQRLFGIADLRVRSAGGGSGRDDEPSETEREKTASTHIGYFRGVDNAHELRDTILERLRAIEDSTEIDSVAAGPAEDPSALLDAARRVLDEARALRGSLERYGSAAGET